MARLSDLNAYRPPKEPDVGALVRFMYSIGWTAQEGARLVGMGGSYGTVARGAHPLQQAIDNAMHMADLFWLTELSKTRFDTPEGRADLEDRLEKKIATINDPAIRKQYTIFMRERLRGLWGFDYNNPRPARNVISISRKQALLGSLENLERMNRAAESTNAAKKDDPPF